MGKSSLRVCLIVPTYNCQEQIYRLLSNLDTELLNFIDEIVVIDNGSTDKTVANTITVLENISCSSKVIINPQNVNLGGTLKRGILYAISKDFTHVMILHGDDQANPANFIPSLKNLNETNAVLIIGARFHPGSQLIGYSWIRKLGNRALNKFLWLVTGTKVDDLIAGLNLYRLEDFKDLNFMKYPNDLTFDVHVLLSAIHAKVEIEFVPITWTESDQKSNAKIYRQGFTILKLLITYKIKGIKLLNSFPQTNLVKEISKNDIVYSSRL
jgi:glycosyltransferase involved in cell wall biosynthesis